ncbi:Transcription factor castor [Nymphon striatum]|nr:Transcription factor castor [Nymphon striatum]
MCKTSTLTNGFNNNAPSEDQSQQKKDEIANQTIPGPHTENVITDEMVKLSGLQANNIIGNPRVILPQNMATTLLTLAALGNGQTSVVNRNTPQGLQQEQLEPSMKHSPAPAMPSGGTPPANQSVVRYASSTPTGNCTVPSPPPSLPPSSSSSSTVSSTFIVVVTQDCQFRLLEVFVKKEEMIRHFKWHKKRDDSLQHGFLRYSPMDDCSEKFPNCSHNRKQTHYHCLMESCDKVYISTSDVQMHANYHRKDSAIIKEGFQRFRATEDCGTQACTFYGQRTTHFHCRRPGCNYNFKNKADMEKHKSYHIKDEQLNKDGFKKFMKHEHCVFENCRFSRVCNHIHCIRPGCTYVLHSSGQLYSHKRKHERRDNEMAYRKFKLQQSMLKALSENSNNNSLSSEQGSIGEQNNFPPVLKSVNNQSNNGDHSGNTTPVTTCANPMTSLNVNSHAPILDSQSPMISDTLPQSFAKFATLLSGVNIANSLSMGNANNNKQTNGDLSDSSIPAAIDLSGGDALTKNRFDESWKKYMKRYTANDLCKPHCDNLYKDHYHCLGENCDMMFKSRDGVREHTRNHEQQEQVTEAFYITSDVGDFDDCPADCPMQGKEKHYHCTWESCKDILTPSDKPFRRLDHYKMHEYSQKLTVNKDSFNFTLASNADCMFKRKRGRPPKNRVVEVCNYPTSSSPLKTPHSIFASFKLPKSSPIQPSGQVGSDTTEVGTTPNNPTDISALMKNSPMFSPFAQMPQLPLMSPTSSGPAAMFPFGMLGAPMPSMKVETQEGFFVYGERSPCPDSSCMFLGKQHYHCIQPRCFYITDRSDILILHSKDFHDNIDISEGFVFYDRNVDCRLEACPSNKVNRHFHCTKPGCNYSFVRYSTMSIHEQRHNENEEDTQSTGQPLNPESPQNAEQDEQNVSADGSISKNEISKTVKAAGTFYPLSAFPTTRGPSTSSDRDTVGSPSGSSSPASTSSHDFDPQQPPKFAQECQSKDKHVQYSVANNCGRPFCKLKKRDHYHCNTCNQAFSSLDRLKPHILKHSGTTSPVTPNGATNREIPIDLPINMNDPRRDSLYKMPFLTTANLAAMSSNPGPLFTSQGMPLIHPTQSLMAAQGLNFYLYGCPPVSMEMLLRNSSPAIATNTSTMTPGTSLLTSAISSPGMMTEQAKIESLKRLNMPRSKNDESIDYKRLKMASLRILKDEPVPDGYIRYRFNEDCQYSHCGYREHQTHFHCMRKDCGYSFCDKTRFVQHTARHERLDTLMGGDFHQFRANIHCGRSECVYVNTIGAMANKASHFHCLKCDFVCTDTNKVVAHRRQHSKLDSIMAAGFEKFTPSQSCQMDNCSHNRRQTHYHCITCQYAVLGLSQMSAHRYRHLE